MVQRYMYFCEQAPRNRHSTADKAPFCSCSKQSVGVAVTLDMQKPYMQGLPAQTLCQLAVDLDARRSVNDLISQTLIAGSSRYWLSSSQEHRSSFQQAQRCSPRTVQQSHAK